MIISGAGTLYSKQKKFRCGLSLLELMITVMVSSVLALAVGALLLGGQRSWQNTYAQANSKMRLDSQAIMSAFGCVGRKSNRLGYTLYTELDGSYLEAVPSGGSEEEVVYGDAVEFRYWSADVPDVSLLDVTNTGTDYAFFYMDEDKLKVDYGTCPPGAVPGGLGARNTTDITTTLLAENVVPDPNGAFNHTVIGGVGQGCVRINVRLQADDGSGDEIRVMTATLTRNIWPR
jgi:prepilin-type N-terminal cleavage/methylation domain-containing protein